MRILRFTISAILLVPIFAMGQQPSPANETNGKRLYTENGCYQCHGYVGQGGGAGPRIAPWTIGAEALITYVRHPAGQMPPYTAKVLPDRDLNDIAAYLKSIPDAKKAKEIPLLNDSNAK